MSGLREVGVLGASVALSGALGYVIWTYLSSGDKEQKAHPKVKTEEEAGSREVTAKEESTNVTSTADVAEQEPSRAESRTARKGNHVLVLGLDGSGKTSLLHSFSGLEQDVAPTEGFNAVSISREDLQIEFLEIGGKEHLRPYWQKYLSQAAVLVFVVDSSRRDLFPTARKHLQELLALDPQLPLVVLANKQDLPGACGITDIHDALSLALAGDRRQLFLIGTYVNRGEAELNSGAQDARDLIIQMASGG